MSKQVQQEMDVLHQVIEDNPTGPEFGQSSTNILTPSGALIQNKGTFKSPIGTGSLNINLGGSHVYLFLLLI